MLRVLIIDESSSYRSILRGCLERTGLYIVVGSAATATAGMQLINTTSPDIVITEVEFRDKKLSDIINCVQHLSNQIDIVIYSENYRQCSKNRLEALISGIKFHAQKPPLASKEQISSNIESKLLPLLLQKDYVESKKAKSHKTRNGQFIPADIDVIVVGASTGGPEALKILLSGLPKICHVPIVIAQHMPVTFTDRLIESLNVVSDIPILRVSNNMPLASNTIYVAPGGSNISIEGNRRRPILKLHETDKSTIYWPSVDKLFESCCKIFGPNTLAMVLTGMGQDGLEGAKTINKSKGIILAQDIHSSTVWGMPGNIVEAELATNVLSIQEMHQLLRMFLLTHGVHNPVASASNGTGS